jgi:hypothetical protein
MVAQFEETDMSDTGKSDAVGKTLEDLKGVGDAARQVGGQAMQVGVDALDQAKDVAQDAKARAGSVAGAIGDKASSIAEDQKSQFADKLEDVAKAVHRSGAQLEGHQDWVAHLVERGAAELSSLATTLRSNDLQGLLGELGNLARRQPALFVGASMAAGFALTRVGRLAASAPAQAAPPAPAATSEPAPVPRPVTRIIPATEPGGEMEVIRERQ